MKLTILVDNNTLIDRYFLGEPGLSIHLADQDGTVLLDAGYSDVFLKNAAKLGISLTTVDHIVLSHGHIDHTWGLDGLLRERTEARIELRPLSLPTLTAHPAVFESRSADGLAEIGAHLDQGKLERHFTLQLTKKPVRLTRNIHYLGEIPRVLDFEASEPMGTRHAGTASAPDTLPDDTALAVETPAGLVVVTGCAHAGVCNTVEHARAVTGCTQVRSIIGGFHLLDALKPRLKATADYIRTLELESLYPCHCTDLAAKCALMQAAPVHDTGSGLVIEFK